MLRLHGGPRQRLRRRLGLKTIQAYRVSIIVPCLNEAGIVQRQLANLQSLRSQGGELILVDGGSRDATAQLATPLVDRVIESAPGRARQMNAGALVAKSPIVWFLHLDTQLPDSALGLVIRAVAEHGGWGRFDVRLSGNQPLFRLIERMMNLRSCLTGIATGDQGIFVERELFFAVGAFPDIPLMEDIALSKQLKRRHAPVCIHRALTTSSRRWEQQGVLRTLMRMWLLRLAYFFGADPARLARWYPPCNTSKPDC